MKTFILFALIVCGVVSFVPGIIRAKEGFIIGHGQMPSIENDKQKTLHVVYGSGDSIMYSYLSHTATAFTPPILIGVLPGLAASHTRGPQIACSNNGLTVTACNADGDIFSYYKSGRDNWVSAARVNDVDTVAKENLMSLGGDGSYSFAVWLDLRGNRQNKIYGARTDDGGKTWSKNKLVYSSPDGTVCQCCKPSVIVKGNHVYVMFRNWLDGNRDLYFIESHNGGNTFSTAEKLGNGNWKLDGCPMDGGGMAVSDKGIIQTIWRREGKLFAAQPGMPEKAIGEGRGCSVEMINDKPVYAWVQDGLVMVTDSNGKALTLGKGSQPVIKSLDEAQMICVWEYEKQIHAAIFNSQLH